MESTAPQQETAWLVQPLVDAGLDPGEIRVLVTRLGFEAAADHPFPVSRHRSRPAPPSP
ncbi:hypothetical protein [Blastococcus sp. SYSU DS0533]